MAQLVRSEVTKAQRPVPCGRLAQLITEQFGTIAAGWGGKARGPVFDPARTVADCFKFRNKIGLDVALEALRDGWGKRKFTLDDLWRHATLSHVASVMQP